METTAILHLNEACKKWHQEMLDKGFTKKDVPTHLMLIVSELSEALEADRTNNHANYMAFEYSIKHLQKSEKTREERERDYKHDFEWHIKDSIEDEIADVFLRLMDFCGAYNIDIDKAIRYKQEYNRIRTDKKRY